MTASQSVLRASDTVARLGGDEFGLLLPKHDTPADVIPALDKIREALEQPIVAQDLPLAIEASIGVSLYPDDGDDVDTLLQHADVAMYAAKEGNVAVRLLRRGVRHVRPRAADDRRRAPPRDRAARARSLLPAEGDARERRGLPRSRRCCAGTTRRAG